jgi:hypothetical protein
MQLAERLALFGHRRARIAHDILPELSDESAMV